MKRSELILECVDAIEATDRMTRKVLSRKDIVEAVLDRAEELGMLPPSYYFGATGEYVPVKTIIKDINDSYDGNFQWEDFEEKECCGGCDE